MHVVVELPTLWMLSWAWPSRGCHRRCRGGDGRGQSYGVRRAFILVEVVAVVVVVVVVEVVVVSIVAA